MATVTEITLTCDVCGAAKDVKTRTFGLDDKAYEIDLCGKDGNRLDRVTAGYRAKARKVRSMRKKASRHPQDAAGAPAGTGRERQRHGVYVYGILPADIEVTGDTPGVGEHPGLLRVVRSAGLAALISEVDASGQLGSAEDLRTYREILDATAVEVPILPLRFGTVLASEDAVAEELLAARHDEFAAALEQLEERVEFQVKGCYVKDTAPEEAASSRDQDRRALRQAMDGLCVASAARELSHELDAVDMAFLVALARERDVEQAIEDLARKWDGRVEVRLLGPMAAYDFPGTTRQNSSS